MKKFILISVFSFLFTERAFSFGVNDTLPFRTNSMHIGYEIHAGITQFETEFKGLSEQLLSMGFQQYLGDYFAIRNIAINGRETVNINRRGCFDGILGYSHYLPTKISNDSSSLTFSGYNIFSSIWGVDFLHRLKFIDLVVNPGMMFGRLKITENKNGEFKYTNPFFALHATADLKIIIWRIALGIRYQYIYDVSKVKWKVKNNGTQNFYGVNQTGPNFCLMLGYYFKPTKK